MLLYSWWTPSGELTPWECPSLYPVCGGVAMKAGDLGSRLLRFRRKNRRAVARLAVTELRPARKLRKRGGDTQRMRGPWKHRDAGGNTAYIPVLNDSLR